MITLVSTVPAEPSAPAHSGLATVIDDLRRNNPFAFVAQAPLEKPDTQPANRVQIQVRGTHLKLTLAVLLAGKGLELIDLRAKRSGTDAVATIIYDLLEL